jgi:hypothetical protein
LLYYINDRKKEKIEENKIGKIREKEYERN